MCHHMGDIPEWTGEATETADEEREELPEFLNEEASGEREVLTDGGDES